MSEHQRKIELQSSADLSYLLDNIRASAQQKLDLHLPLSEAQGEDDAFRNNVNTLVQQYIQDTIALALPSLSVNGLDAGPSILSAGASQVQDASKWEPYDTRLAQKVRELYATLEEETTKAANLRREAPKKASQIYLDTLSSDLEVSEKAFQARQAEIAKEQLPVLQDVAFSSNEDITENWTQGKKDLEELRNVTKVKADLERAIRAAAEVEKKKRG